MRRWVPGMAVIAVLAGCPFPGMSWLQTQGSPTLEKRFEATEIRGMDHRIQQSLNYLLAGQAPDMAFKLDVVEFEDKEKELINRVFPDYRSAIAYAESKGHYNFLPSADQVSAITKQINDGLYARFELALENGEGGFPAKRQWLKQMLDAALKDVSTPAKRDLAARLAGGLTLSHQAPALPADIQSQLDNGLTTFRQDPVQSKPISFFTWSEPLKTVFTRDRWLQGWFGEDKRAWLVRDDGAAFPDHLEAAIQANALLDSNVRPGYAKTLDFYRKMTNKFSGYSPLDIEQLLPAGATLRQAQTDPALQAQMIQAAKQRASSATTDGPPLQYWAILPPSTSPEMELFFKLDSLGQLPPNADRMQVLIDSIRQGKLSLAPGADTGYYTYQQHALEALLKVASLPEGQKVSFGAKYQKRLEEAFKTGMTKARETHAKQLDLGPMPTSVPMPPQGPPWVVEPLPTFYERQAAGYAFLRKQVLPLFDTRFTTSAKALLDGGREGTQSLAQSLDEAESLMSGLALLAKAGVGLAKVDDPTKVQTAADWIKGINNDPRLAVDTRVAVPVNQYRDGNRHMVQYWGTAGVTLTKVKAEGNGDVDYLILSDKFIFFDRPYDAGPLDRDEYRTILDEAGTLGEALRKLQGG